MMYKLIAIGDQKFALGFQLVGIQSIIAESAEELRQAFNSMLIDKQIGIIITSQETLDKLDYHLKYKVETSIRPITVVLSTVSTGQEILRKKVQKAIGVDVWNK